MTTEAAGRAPGYTGNLRAAQKQRTRRAFLDEGLSLFAEKGYLNTTLDDIAMAVGSTKATFYIHFPSKVDLMLTLVEEMSEILRSSQGPTLVDAVASGSRTEIREWLSLRVNQWPDLRLYLLAAHEARACEPAVAAFFRTWFDTTIASIQRGLDQAQRFDPGSRRSRGILAFGQLDFAARHYLDFDWDAPKEELINRMTDSWCALLVDEESGGPRPD